MKTTILTISALCLLAAGTAFGADPAPQAEPKQGGCCCAAMMKSEGQGHAGHMHGQQPPADQKTQPARTHKH